MAEQVTVSVIIPVYNGADSLRDCLDNVCNQSLHDIEVLCVDDCSTDDSLSVLQEYASRYPFVRVLQQEVNQGSGPARNAGLDQARGAYVAFMDADDAYQHKDTLSNLYTCATEQGAAICGGTVRFTRSRDGSEVERYGFPADGWVDYRDYQQRFYYQRFLFSRKLIEEHRLRFPPYLRFQDPPFFVRAMLAAERFYALNEIVYVYRNDNQHVTWNSQKVRDMLKGTRDVLQLCRAHRLDQLYFETLQQCLESRFLHDIWERSLTQGSTDVIDFCKHLLESLDRELLGDRLSELDLGFATAVSEWKPQWNMGFSARSIALQEPPAEDRPAVSVIVPVYKTGEYLEECMGSLLAQTLTQIEIICIDDGSPDNCGNLLDKMEREDSRIRVYHQRNQGLSAARNEGLRHAQGEYVYFMDSDDTLDLQALSELYAQAKEQKADVVYFGAESFFDSDCTQQEREECTVPMLYAREGDYPPVATGQKMYASLCANEEYFPSVCLQFARTAFLRENDLAFFEGIYHEDNLYTMEGILRARAVCCSPKRYFHRRIRSGSIMTTETSYKNLLGYFLTVRTALERLPDIPMQSHVLRLVEQRLQRIVRYQLVDKFQSLPPAEQMLFRVSLTDKDRMLFQTLLLPAIQLREAAKKPQASVSKKALDRSQRTVRELQAQLIAMRKSTTWKVGRLVTWIPRKLIGFIRVLFREGPAAAAKNVGQTVRSLPKTFDNLRAGR